MEKQRIFFDLDGVLAVWQDVPVEDVVKRGYFARLPAQENVVHAFRILERRPDMELFILSSVFQDNHSEQDKRVWVDKHLGLMYEHQIYCPCDRKKETALERIGGIRASDVLIDDYSRNLQCWSGIPIKMYNGINGTKGTWHGHWVHAAMPASTLAGQICAIAAVYQPVPLERISK